MRYATPILMAAIALGGCSGSYTAADPSGTYFGFVDGKPQAALFHRDDFPAAVLQVSSDKRWNAPNPITGQVTEGTWTLDEQGRLVLWVGDKTMSVLRVGGGTAAYVSGPLRWPGDTLYTMPAEWEEGMHEQSRRDGFEAAARDVAKAALMCAYDGDESLPTGERAFNEALLPYLGDDHQLLDFDYTFPGGKIPPEGAEPVEIGRLRAGDTYVIVFTDASTKWADQ